MNDHFKLVYGTVGNHESHPANIFEPSSLGNDTQWVYDALAGDWSKWLNEKAAQDVKSIGSYSVKYPNGNLRIISLNTNMYYRFNFILYQKTMEKDPNGQIAWLVKELDAAEKAGENVYIIGHMPFGVADSLPNQSNYLDQVIARYSSTIRAMFFGHTHVDHFEVSYSDYAERTESNAFAISYICPSLTPTSGMPSFRVYDVDPDTFAILDATTYIADMNDTAFQQSAPVWKKYYSVKEAYGSVLSPPVSDPEAELTPAFWHNVTQLFERNVTIFDEYMSRKSRGWQDEGKCRDNCQNDEICQLRAGRSQDNCHVLSPGVHFSKRRESSNNGEYDDCGASVSMETFHALAGRQDLLELLQRRVLDEGAYVHPYKRAQPAQTGELSSTKSLMTDECVPVPTRATNSSTITVGSTSVTSTGGASHFHALGFIAILAIGGVAV